MCALAFFAALPVGEITSRANTPPFRILQIDQLPFLRNRDSKIETVKIIMRNFKHGSHFQPSELLVHRDNTAMCPASLLSEYIAVRGSRPGPLTLTGRQLQGSLSQLNYKRRSSSANSIQPDTKATVLE